MKLSSRTVTQHTATFSNGVTVTRESVADIQRTLIVQIENARTAVKCVEAQLETEKQTLASLEQDLHNLDPKQEGL